MKLYKKLKLLSIFLVTLNFPVVSGAEGSMHNQVEYEKDKDYQMMLDEEKMNTLRKNVNGISEDYASIIQIRNNVLKIIKNGNCDVIKRMILNLKDKIEYYPRNKDGYELLIKKLQQEKQVVC